ncbi:MAG: glycosyltransferase family 39 protein [Dehalococcoidia bacterium]
MSLIAGFLDRYLWFVIAGGAIVAALIAFNYYYSQGLTLVYADGIAKLNNGRRIFDNPENNFSLVQSGSIWLPAQSLLVAITTWISLDFYQTGIPGTIWSMASFVLATVLLYQLVVTVTKSRLGGIAAGIISVSNLNHLYFATTPMTESLIIACFVLVVYCLVRYEQDMSDRWLRRSALALAFSCFVRYEMWFMTIVAIGCIALTLSLKRVDRNRLICDVSTLFFVPGLAILGWLIYQRAVFGSFFYFSSSKYSAHAIDVIGANKSFVVHEPVIAIDQYFTAVRYNVPLSILFIGTCGLAVFLSRCLVRRERVLAPMYLIGIPVFFIISLTLGQNAIDMRLGKGLDYNIRYGTAVLPLVAFGVGYFVAMLARCRFSAGMGMVLNRAGKVAAVGLVAVVVLVTAPLMAAARENTAVLGDAAAQRSPAMEEFAAVLDLAWDGKGGRDVSSEPALLETLMGIGNPAGGGRILADGFGVLNTVQLLARVSLRYFVTDSSPVLYEEALTDPRKHHIEWIIIREGDVLDRYFESDSERLTSFVKVFENDFGRLYYFVPE